MIFKLILSDTIKITIVKKTGLANIGDMVPIAQHVVKRDTNVPGAFEWENNKIIIKSNR